MEQLNDYYSAISVDNKQAMECMKLCAQTESTCMLWGGPGVGKTTMVYDLAHELEMPCVVINPSQDDVIDFKLPYLDQGKWKTEDGGSVAISRFAYSERLPVDKPALIFVDEINTANQAMQATLYSLVLEGRIGSYRVPKGTLRFAAGNREHDNCAAQPMSVALKDRLSLHINVVPKQDAFVDYARTHGFMPEVIAFIREAPQNLDGVDNKDPSGGCTPRSLEYLSDKLKLGIPESLQHIVFAGTIGKAAAMNFAGFLDIYRSNVRLEEILKNPKGATIPDRMDVLYCVCTALGYIADEKNLDQIMQYVNRMDTAYAALVVGDIIAKNSRYQSHKSIAKFILDNVDLIAYGIGV